MAHIIITGKDFMDIDMVAGVQALYELLTIQGNEVYVEHHGSYSASVTQELQKRISPFPEKKIEKQDGLIAVDVSSTEYLDKQCGYPLDQFVGIYDHHFESTDYWKEKLGDAAVIEEVGAASTLVVEAIKKEGVWEYITEDTKVLLAAAIVSNSQNFKFSMTSQRDHDVYEVLKEEVNLSYSFAGQYLLSIQDEIGQDVIQAIKNDTKERVALGDKTFTIAQLEMWNTSLFISKHKNEVISFLESSESDIAFFLSASLSEDKTYFLVANKESEKFVSNLMEVSFTDGLALAEKIIIRKEVVKKILDNKN